MLSETEIISRLSVALAPKRFAHTLGVKKAACLMAQSAGGDVYNAGIAALLHDCAKCITDDKIQEMLETSDISVADDELTAPNVLHAPCGVLVAKAEYGVLDNEILGAIRWHTVGKKDMSLTEKIIFTADMIEEGRKPFEGIEDIRRAAYGGNIDLAVLMSAKSSCAYVRKCGGTPCKSTLELIESLKTVREGI